MERFIIKDMDKAFHVSIFEDSNNVLKLLNEIEPSSEFNYLLFCVKTTEPKVDVRLYENHEEIINDYTRCIIRNRDDYEFFSFHKQKENSYMMILLPPIIGPDIETKIRPIIEDM